MPKLTDNEIAEAKRLCEKATPGPWYLHSNTAGLSSVSNSPKTPYDRRRLTHPYGKRLVYMGREGFEVEESEANATFIAAARDLLPRALAELEALRAFRRRVKALHDDASDLKLLDTSIADLLAEHREALPDTEGREIISLRRMPDRSFGIYVDGALWFTTTEDECHSSPAMLGIKLWRAVNKVAERRLAAQATQGADRG